MSALTFDCRFAYPAGFSLDFQFEIGPGVTALLGPSGAGKTTVLHLIAGILQPADGKILVGDRVLFDSRRRINVPMHERRVGLVFQDYQLFPHYSVEGNLRYGLCRGSSKSFELAHLVDVLELGPILTRPPASLSGGQKQRVALGRAIASCPSLLLLDEPVSALDEDLRSSVLAYLVRVLREYQTPTLFVTHDTKNVTVLDANVVRIPPDARATNCRAAQPPLQNNL